MRTSSNGVLAASLTALAVVVATIAAFFGSGALGGTPIDEAAGGALSADATPLAPAGPAFSIWSVIYTGLVAYAIYQLLPSPRRTARHVSLRPWAAASALLNAAWIWAVQLGSVTASVVVIILLLAVLVRILVLLVRTRSGSWLDLLVTDGTFGLYLGWVCVATVANIAAWVATWGVGQFPGWEWAAGAVAFVAAGIGIALATWARGRIAPSLAIAWGLGWIAVGRTGGSLESPVVVWSAGLASAAVLIATAVLLRMRPTSRDTRTVTD
ncbi:tryptophan-rich sensory protein [Nesterenkonia sp. NBAIMH1]|uniref:tryptophan-rich sensory protein n=1 Tax=Nesterenkonia sp. NBAIMH1 TaxID=2600320 RepID=UPI0011B6424B|nr:tryptophan-rich sensory protein [Nesterenkonia sp. NBAIMH1]